MIVFRQMSKNFRFGSTDFRIILENRVDKTVEKIQDEL